MFVHCLERFFDNCCEVLSIDKYDKGGFRVAPGDVTENLINRVLKTFRSAPKFALCNKEVVVLMAHEDICLTLASPTAAPSY